MVLPKVAIFTYSSAIPSPSLAIGFISSHRCRTYTSPSTSVMPRGSHRPSAILVILMSLGSVSVGFSISYTCPSHVHSTKFPFFSEFNIACPRLKVFRTCGGKVKSRVYLFQGCPKPRGFIAHYTFDSQSGRLDMKIIVGRYRGRNGLIFPVFFSLKHQIFVE